MSKKILVVEDEKAISRIMIMKLVQEGYSVDLADDGDKAINFFLNNKYDCILLDLILPRKDGFDVLAEVRSQDKEIKVMVLTNLGQVEDKLRVEKMGIQGYYVKSEMSIYELIGKVKELLA